MSKGLITVCLCCTFLRTFSQSSIKYNKAGFNDKATAVPFLLLSPDARASGMGSLGAASSPDVNSIFWNASKYAMSDNAFGFATSFLSPNYQNDLLGIYNLGFAGYTKIKRSAIATSVRYFTLGSTQFTDSSGNNIGVYKPKELAFDLSYCYRLSKHYSLGSAVRYLYSNLTNSIPLPNGTVTHPGTSFVGDFSFYYRNRNITIINKIAEVGMGLNISNIGPPIVYTDGTPPSKDFIPTQGRLGGCLKLHLNDRNSLSALSDITRLLIPTLPYTDSFTELQKINVAIGTEYIYHDLIAVRAGYINKIIDQTEYLSLGTGIKYYWINFDLAFQLSLMQTALPQNILQFTLSANFSSAKKPV